ncbi:unnamed protein product [Polarella glacialis]|uniref:Saccharopine dehydrogenase NADP binding domain-containing protein n=2 Tax=Polarella glacialis TaxID=89957 RepID=A0A813H4X0_POLGL|nr:unnamed protein product [Polarella glacialis]
MARAGKREFDAIIFGATGFTGQQTVMQFGRLSLCASWAVAGRSREKLEALKAETQVVAGIVVADVDDPASLKQMASRARLVLNATGPYRFFGEAVVAACIESGTDYIDLCGEPEFMEKMLLRHNDAARAAGVVVCHACAFDSIPADLGILRCAQIFQAAGGECAHVEMFHYVDAPQGYTGHDTTFKAAVHGVGAAEELKRLRKDVEEKYGKVPDGCQALGKLPAKGQVSTEPRLGGKYVMPFIGSDASVVRSSRRVQANILKQPDCEKLMPQFGIYFAVAYTSSLLKVVTGGSMFQMLAKSSWGRDLLIRHPSFFTWGGFSAEGPTEEQMQNNCWIGDLFASGLVGGEKMSLTLQARLEDPGYIGTSMLFATVAETILTDRGSLSAQGGVFTPAALFGRSSLLERLARRGFEFKVIESDLPGVLACSGADGASYSGEETEGDGTFC